MMADSRPRILKISDCGNWLLAAYDKFCIMWNITDIIARKKKYVVLRIMLMPNCLRKHQYSILLTDCYIIGQSLARLNIDSLTAMVLCLISMD